MHRVIRTLLLTAFALSAWLVSVSASAASGSAGLCGERGTSEVAPAPLLMPSEASLEQGDPFFSCEGGWEQHSVQRGQQDRSELSASAEMTLPDRLVVLRAGSELAHLAPNVSGALKGVRSSVERPPRSF